MALLQPKPTENQPSGETRLGTVAADARVRELVEDQREYLNQVQLGRRIMRARDAVLAALAK